METTVGYRGSVLRLTIVCMACASVIATTVGSIAWCGALSHNGYENNVSRITENVLRRFLAPEHFEFPRAPHP